MKVSINGLGRIGRLFLRAALEANIEVVAANTPGDPEIVSHLINYDSTHGTLEDKFLVEGNYICNSKTKIRLYNEATPKDIPWGFEDVDLVVECSGKFSKIEELTGHLKNNVQKVLISYPCADADITVVMGVNESKLISSEYSLISMGSCTTNALVPVAKVLNDKFIIKSGYVTTIHSYTNDQNILDNNHKDFRRARACAVSMIPTKTGAAKNISLVLPELEGKVHGSAIRVPTTNVSLIDFTFCTEKKVSIETINLAFMNSANNEMKKIIGITDQSLVSVDFNHSTFSAILDLLETRVAGEYFGRILAWYDNEWAFVQRMVDVCKICLEK